MIDLKNSILAAAVLFGVAACVHADDAKPKKEIKKGQMIEATIAGVDTVKSSITVKVKDETQNYSVGKDCKIMIKGKEDATLNDLKTDTRIALLLSDDKKTVMAIKVAGNKETPKPNKEAKKGEFIEATVKSVDTAKSTITITAKDKDQTLEVGKDAKIMLKGKDGGSLADIKPEMRVALMLSPDKKSVLGIKAGAKNETKKPTKEAAGHGELKSVDAAKNTVVISTGKKGNVVDQTFAISKNAQIVVAGNKNAAIADLKPGTQVAFMLSDDKKSITSIKSAEKKMK
jgi:hypothetical protein